MSHHPRFHGAICSVCQTKYHFPLLSVCHAAEWVLRSDLGFISRVMMAVSRGPARSPSSLVRSAISLSSAESWDQLCLLFSFCHLLGGKFLINSWIFLAPSFHLQIKFCVAIIDPSYSACAESVYACLVLCLPPEGQLTTWPGGWLGMRTHSSPVLD